MAYIYTITNNINNKKYVGKTSHSDPNIRWSQHKSTARLTGEKCCKLPIYNAIRKYGIDNFKYTIIEECSEVNVNLRETHWITLLDTYSKGYNCTLGGEGTKMKPEDYGKYRESREVDCYTLEGKFVKSFLSLSAAKYWALSNTENTIKNKSSHSQSIWYNINGKTSQAYGYKWTYKDEPLININVREYKIRKVTGINPEFGWTKCWKSQADCAEDIANNRKNNCAINLSLRSKQSNKKSAYGWYLFWGESVPTNYKPCERNIFAKGNTYAKQCKEKVKGIDVNNPDNVLYFDSLSEASLHIKGNKSGVGNISNNIKNLQNNENWKHCYGYRWYKILED